MRCVGKRCPSCRATITCSHTLTGMGSRGLLKPNDSSACLSGRIHRKHSLGGTDIRSRLTGLNRLALRTPSSNGAPHARMTTIMVIQLMLNKGQGAL